MHRCSLVVVVVLAVLQLAVACGPSSSANSGDRDAESPPPSRDRTTGHVASGGEAADCLSLEDEMGRLGAKLDANEREAFAGLEIVYEPKACAVAYFINDVTAGEFVENA